MTNRKAMDDRDTIVIANHIPSERHITLLRKAGSAQRPRIQLLIFQPPVAPMPMWAEHCGHFASRLFWTVKVAADVMAGKTLEVNFLNRISATINFIENRWIEWLFVRQGQ